MRIGPLLKAVVHALPVATALPIERPQVVLGPGPQPHAPGLVPTPPTPRPSPPSANLNGLEVSLQQVAKFAPIVQFHPAEPYLPCSIEYLLDDAKLVDDAGSKLNIEPTQDDLLAHRGATYRVLIDPEHYAGEPLGPDGRVQAPMYVSVQVPDDHSFVDLNYIFLFAYNGAQTARARIPALSYNVELPHFAEHEGDIEGISVRVSPDFEHLEFVRVEGHGHSEFLRPHEFSFSGQHPVVRSALNSHATYGNGSLPWNPTTSITWMGWGVEFIDLLDHRGPRWEPDANQLVMVGLNNQRDPINNETWATFAGTFGRHWTNSYTGACGIGRAPLTWWKAAYTDALAWVAQHTGLSKNYRDSDGTAGLAERPFINVAHPVWRMP